MRLLVHRGQVLLLLVVGVLAGVAVGGVCVQLTGIPVTGVLHLDQVFAAPHTQMPSQIVIGRAAPAPSNDSAVAGSVRTPAAPPEAGPALAPASVQPTASTAVVPGDVYVYPPDGHGSRGGPGGGSGGGGGGRGGRSG